MHVLEMHCGSMYRQRLPFVVQAELMSGRDGGHSGRQQLGVVAAHPALGLVCSWVPAGHPSPW